MSVEDVMKVNKLAQDLLDQGLAASREDAVKRAQEMLAKEIAGNDIKMEETDEKQNIAVQDDSLDKLKNMVERTKEYNERHFKDFKEHIEKLYGEINTLKEEVISLKAKGVSKTAQDSGLSEKSTSEAVEEPKEEQKELPKEEKEDPHPKKGNYNSEDVAVDKIFYFGNK